MATFIITYDTHKDRNYSDLYKGMAEHNGVRLAESLWGIDFDHSATEVKDWVRDLLDNDDTIIVVQVKSGSDWAIQTAPYAVLEWFKERLGAW